RLDIEGERRGIGLNAEGVENGLFRGQGLARNGDFADGETGIGKPALSQGGKRGDAAANGFMRGIETGGAGKKRRNHEGSANGRAMENESAIEAIIDALQRGTARRNRERAGIDGTGPGEKCLALYLLQLASSTNQETNSS